MSCSGSHSAGDVAGRAKCLLILGVVCWAACATAWLIALSTHGHCPMARTARVLMEDREMVATSLSRAFNVTKPQTSMLPSSSPDATQSQGSNDELLQYYSSKIYGGDGGDKCTMVMLTYKREALLPRVLNHYCKVSSLRKILVIWNDVGTPVPQAMLNRTKDCQIDIKFIVSDENKLTNRYLPRSEIDTECVCLMDDDRMVEVADMNFGFEVWKANRHRVVGFEERSFIKGANGKFIYTNYERRRFLKTMIGKTDSSRLPPGYTIEVKDGVRLLHVRNKTFVLGKSNLAENQVPSSHHSAGNLSQKQQKKSEGYNIMLNSCFLHRAYLEMYFDPQIVPHSLLEYVDEQKNCEDILMSIVATNFLKDIGRPQCGVLAVKSGWVSNLEEEAQEQGGREGLSARPDHYKARSKCLEKFSQSYGFLPLHTSRLIMTRVAYHL